MAQTYSRRFGIVSLFFIFLVAGVFFVSPKLSFAAFGVSPPFVNATHLVPGAVYTQTIYLVQDNPSSDLTVNATLNVPDAIRSWVSLDKGFQFVIPAGTQQFPVLVTVTVPSGQSLGSYQGNLLLATAPNSAGQVTIALGANVSLNITVGNGIYEQYSIPYITLPSIEEGWNPRATFRFQNDGNVSEQLTGATFSLYDQYDAVQLAYLAKNSGLPTVPPFTAKEYTIEFPTTFHLGIGDYWGVVTFYKNDQAVASQKLLFHVLPKGSLSSPIDIFIQNLGEYWVYYLAGIIAVFLIIWRIIAMRRRSRSY